MSNQSERPIFYENQILGAADLTAAVEHPRGQEARHNRYLHLWGIALGLELTGEDKKDGAGTFKKITLSAGLAIDGAGREIIIPQSEPLSETTFSQLQLTAGLTEEAWFPVFLTGRDEAASQPPLAIGGCDSSLPSRLVEGYDITFDRPGKARDIDQQDGSQVGDGPGNGGWRILLGFVQCNKNGDKFTNLKYEVDGIGRRYAGVQADEVAARSGSLKLRTRTAAQSGKPALVLNEEMEGLLQFGPLNSQGQVAPVFTVDAQGNVTAEGKIKGAFTTGTVQVESGIATDGMILPLPPGITEKQVADGEAIVHAQVSLRLMENAAPASLSSAAPVAATPLEMWVDDERRVHCRVRWFQIGGSVTLAPGPVTVVAEDHPGACGYVVLASVKEKQA